MAPAAARPPPGPQRSPGRGGTAGKGRGCRGPAAPPRGEGEQQSFRAAVRDTGRQTRHGCDGSSLPLPPFLPSLSPSTVPLPAFSPFHPLPDSTVIPVHPRPSHLSLLFPASSLLLPSLLLSWTPGRSPPSIRAPGTVKSLPSRCKKQKHFPETVTFMNLCRFLPKQKCRVSCAPPLLFQEIEQLFLNRKSTTTILTKVFTLSEVTFNQNI